MKQAMVYVSYILNVVFIAVCVFMVFYFHVPGKIARHLDLKKWKSHNEKIVMTGDRLIGNHWKGIIKRNDILFISNRSGEISFVNSHLDVILGLKPTVCIITANAYDVYYSGKPKDAFNQYKYFIDKIRENNIMLVVQLALIATPDKLVLNEFVSNANEFNELLKNYCIAKQIEWLDVNPFITELHHYKPQYSYRKGVSLNHKGYEIWGKELVHVLNGV